MNPNRGIPFDKPDNKDEINNKKGLHNDISLGLVSFFTDFSTEMILSILPLSITNNLGASKAILGIIDGSADLINYIFGMIAGSISDKFRKRKIFILIGYGLSL